MPRLVPPESKPYEDWSEILSSDIVGNAAPLVAGAIYEAFRYGEPEQFVCQAVINQKGRIFGRFVRYGISDEQYEWTPERASSVRLVWAPPIPGSPTFVETQEEDIQEEAAAPEIPAALLQAIVAEQVEAAVANAVSTFSQAGPTSAAGQVTPEARISPRTGKPTRAYQKKPKSKKK